MEVINASTKNLRNVLHECSVDIGQELKEGLLGKRWITEDTQKWIIGPESVNIYWSWNIFRCKKNICEVLCEYDSALGQTVFFQLFDGKDATLLS